MSTFMSFDIARKALTVSQKAIDVTGHNIANANTSGYTRQRLVTVSVEPGSGNSRFAVSERGTTGGGVVPVTVDQIRNPFLDRQFRRENARASELATRSENLAYVERLFDGLSGTGLPSALAQFSASVQEAAKNPASKEFRANLVQNALKLTETFQHAASQLADKQADIDHSIKVQAGQINDLARTVADYNGQIALFELGGQRANDLRDKQNALLDELSGLAGFTASETEQGSFEVRIGGHLLVDHTESFALQTVRDVTDPLTGQANALHRLAWQDDGTPLQTDSGSMRALLDLRDGNAPDRIGLPWLAGQLDQLAAGLADTFNAVHASGWSLPDAATGQASATGISFFSGRTAATLQVNPEISANLNLIALASQEVRTQADAGNNRNALALGDLFSRHDLPSISSYTGFMESFSGALAIECAHTDKRLDGQKILLGGIEQQRQSVSGVSMDEEMTSMIRYEKSYAAAARLISTIDEMLDVLVNRMGMVGR